MRAAGWLVVAALGIISACLLTACLDGVSGGTAARADEAARLYRAIGLNQLALTPAGRPDRPRDFLPMGIDARFLPVLPQDNPDVLPLLEARQLDAPRAKAP